MISAIQSLGAPLNTEPAGPRGRLGEDAGTSSFALLLAGLVGPPQTPATPTEAPTIDETSELDGADGEIEEGAGASSDASTVRHDGVVSAFSALDPDMQARLARVMSRMKQETGRGISIVETYRSQDRQDALFAQGRGTPGPIVTWTRNSRHTQGRAADVMIEGGFTDQSLIDALHRIAGEEGLRTLGAKDPGHLELPGSTTQSTQRIPDVRDFNRGSQSGFMSQVASVAQVAQVARVADVAQVATVEDPGFASTSTVSQFEIAANASNTGSDLSGFSGGSNSGNPGDLSFMHALHGMSASDAQAFADPISAAYATSSADRVMELLDAREQQSRGPVSRLTLSLDGQNERVQVALRGGAVSAAIDTLDLGNAERMVSRADELARSLAREGLDAEALRVRAVVAGTMDSYSKSSDNTTRYERSFAWQHERQSSGDDRRRESSGGRHQRGGQHR
jgi:hypothetical protein